MYINRKEELEKLLNIIDKIDKIDINLDYLRKNLKNSQSIELVNKIEKEINFNRESIKELNNPFLLFIMGNGNYGKSTLINSLLQENRVKTNDLPNSWKLDIFTKGKYPKVEVLYNNKKNIIRSIDESVKILELEEKRYKESKQKIFNLVNKYKRNNNISIKELKMYKNELEKRYLYKSNIIQFKYYLKSENILNDFIIVDTPGFNQTLLKDTLDRMKGYYLKSDGVIWVVDAQNLVSKENSKLLNEIKHIESISSGPKNKILVINKMDIVRNIDADNVNKVKNKAYEIYKDKFKDIIFLSAKEAIDGILNNNYELINKSNIKKLYESIDINFKNVSEINQIKSKYQNINIMKNNIINEIHSYKRRLYKDISVFIKINNELKEKINEFKKDTNNYLDNIKKRKYKNDEDINSLKKSILEFEEVCNLNLSNLYESMCLKSNFNKEYKINKINTKIYFSKNKNLIFNYSTLKSKTESNISENIFNIQVLKNSNSKSYSKYLIQNIIYNKIQKLSKEIEDIIDNKLKEIYLNLELIKNESFKSKYVCYLDIQNHINYFNNIENILTSLGEKF